MTLGGSNFGMHLQGVSIIYLHVAAWNWSYQWGSDIGFLHLLLCTLLFLLSLFYDSDHVAHFPLFVSRLGLLRPPLIPRVSLR